MHATLDYESFQFILKFFSTRLQKSLVEKHLLDSFESYSFSFQITAQAPNGHKFGGFVELACLWLLHDLNDGLARRIEYLNP